MKSLNFSDETMTLKRTYKIRFQKAQIIKEKIDKFDYIKNKTLSVI